MHTVVIDQEAAIRLRNASADLEPPADRIAVNTRHPSGANVFVVGDELFAAYEAELGNPLAAVSPCASANPCYSPLCVEPITDPPTLTAVAPNTAVVGAANTTVTLTGTNFLAPMTATIDPPGVEVAVTAPVTVVSPTSATVVVPASALDAAGVVTIAAVTANGTSATQNITVA